MANVDVLSFIKKAGFVWGPEPEIYGGTAGLYTYGPTGKLLKNHIENKIRELFVSNGFWEIEAPIIMPEKVWKASGHLERFVDRTVRCKKCGAVFRADKIIEESHDVAADAFSNKEILDFIKKKKIGCPNCKGTFESKIYPINLMMKTEIGGETAYNRPETATTTYLPFKNYYEFFRRKMPMKVFQIGKAFRNEVSPRQNIIRGREFTQAEAQVFLFEEDKDKFEEYEEIKHDKLPLWPSVFQKVGDKHRPMSIETAIKKKYLGSRAYSWCLNLAYQFILEVGIPKNKIRIRQHAKEEMAHYAKEAWDIEVNLNTYGWTEIVGVHDRQEYDLEQHEKESGQKLQVEGKRPHILEIAFGSDRPVFALLDLLIKSEKVKGEERVVLQLPKDLAPVQVAVFPLLRKDKLPEKAEAVLHFLREKYPNFHIMYDEAGSIGRRYRRMDQIGTPYCITIDHDTLKDNTVTVRDRDTMKQTRVNWKELDLDF